MLLYVTVPFSAPRIGIHQRAKEQDSSEGQQCAAFVGIQDPTPIPDFWKHGSFVHLFGYPDAQEAQYI